MEPYKTLPVCDRATSRYVKREGLGVELETGALLYALVRLIKPDICVETGLFIGDSAEWIGRALQDNGYGHLHTCDVDPARIEPGRARLAGLPVTIHQKAGIELLAEFPQMDFVHIDSGHPDMRDEEIKTLGDHNISPLGILAWHDACVAYENQYFNFTKRNPEWRHIVFPTLVGVAVFQRPQ